MESSFVKDAKIRFGMPGDYLNENDEYLILERDHRFDSIKIKDDDGDDMTLDFSDLRRHGAYLSGDENPFEEFNSILKEMRILGDKANSIANSQGFDAEVVVISDADDLEHWNSSHC